MNRTWLVIAGTLALSACANTASDGPSASVKLEPRSGSKVTGTVNFRQVGDRVHVTGEVTGHTPGRKGFHIHDKGDCSAPDAMSAGGHFNPHGAKHGSSPTTGHAGDMGNLTFDAQGRAKVDMMLSGISVGASANGIVGRAVVVHAQEDDLKSDPTGNAGGRAACGVIRS